MIDLKPYYDAVQTADAEVQKIAHEIDGHMQQGGDEAVKAALALQDALDAAQTKHAEMVALYESVSKANRPNDIAKNFIPVSTTSSQAEPATNSQPTSIGREAYDRLSLVDRALFIRSGGTVSDKI